jgi:hypothetical protein
MNIIRVLKTVCVSVCLLSVGLAYAQENKPLSIGLVSNITNDFTQKLTLEPGLNGSYSTGRVSLMLELLYGVAPKWRARLSRLKTHPGMPASASLQVSGGI